MACLPGVWFPESLVILRLVFSLMAIGDKRNQRWRVIAIIFIVGLCLAIFLAGVAVKILISRPVGDGEEFSRLVSIPRGASLREITRILAKNGLMPNKAVFYLLVTFSADANNLKAGTYCLSSAMSLEKIHQALRSGTPTGVKVTIPEGWTVEQIAQCLTARGLVTTKEEITNLCQNQAFVASLGLLISSLEGYLFPDTYFFSGEEPPELLIKKMVTNFRQKMAAVHSSQQGFGEYSLHQILTLASIIEREAKLDEEKPLIASVYYNRLKLGKRLESCATVHYALNNWTKPLSTIDLQTASPYNTYRRKGLPPGPICSPGLGAIKAALEPAESDFLYFCYRGDGRHAFACTLEEHNDNIKKYLKGKKDDR